MIYFSLSLLVVSVFVFPFVVGLFLVSYASSSL